MTAAACLTLAFVHAMVWWRRRTALGSLLFALTTVCTAGLGAAELGMMTARTPEEFGWWLRMVHVPTWGVMLSLVAFVRVQLKAGRAWLAWLVCGLRSVSLVFNFGPAPNLNYQRIDALHEVSLFGESVSVAVGEPNRLMILGQLSLVLFLVFVTDATLEVWRRGGRRGAVWVGAGIVFFVSLSTCQAIVALWGWVPMPITASLFHLGLVAAMACELSRDVWEAAHLSDRLRESDQRMTLAAEAANLGIWIRDLEKEEIWANETWRAMFGFGSGESLGLDPFLRRVHEKDRGKFLQAMERAAGGDGSYRTDYRVLRPDGEMRWIESSGRVEFDAAHKPVLTRGVCMDITDRKQAAADLRDSEEFSKTVLDAMAASIAVLDGCGVIVAVNARWREFAREHPDSLTAAGPLPRAGVGVNFLAECLRAGQGAGVAREGEAVAARESGVAAGCGKSAHDGILAVMEGRVGRFSLEYLWDAPQGERWFAMTVNPVGRRGRSVVVSQVDITERKIAEEQFRLVVEAASNGMIMADSAGSIVLVNAQTEQIFGYDRSALLGSSIETLIPERFRAAHPGFRAKFQADPKANAIRAGRRFIGRRKDGTEVPLEIGINPIRTSQGRFVLASLMDISEREKAEREEERHRNELAHLSRVSMLGEMAGAIAHELNQPLAAILSNSQVGRRSVDAGAHGDAEETAAIFDDIAADAKRAGGIIHGMRAMFKKDAAMEIQCLDLNEAAQQAVSLVHSEIISRKVRLTLDLHRPLPPVMAGRVGIQQILINLLINAMDALDTLKSSLAVAEIRIATAPCGSMAELTVRDNGPGISPQMQDTLFEPFASTKRAGLGMGLAISRSMAEQFHGKLLAENHPGGGACFRLLLPTAPPMEPKG